VRPADPALDAGFFIFRPEVRDGKARQKEGGQAPTGSEQKFFDN